MQDDPRLRTRVIRFLKDADGEPHSIESIALGTGLEPTQVKRGIDHNHFIDSLRPNLYYGVIQRIEVEGNVTYRFNKAQYVQNRTRWIDGRGKKRDKGGNDFMSNLPKPRQMIDWLRRHGGKGGK